MTKRLKEIIALIDSDKGVIDVGTDHGYIPIELALSGYSGNIIATDINIGPLNSAVRSAEENGVADRISFRLSDGLKDCSFKEADNIIIAGMGGDLICRILDETSWLKRPHISLLLQPMSKPEILRYYLINQNWKITDEVLINENKRIFQIIKAIKVPGITDSYSDAELFTGKLDNIRHFQCSIKLVSDEIIRLSKKLKSDDSKFYFNIVKQLTEMRSSLDNCK